MAPPKKVETSLTWIVNLLLALIGGINLIIQDGLIDSEQTKLLLLVAAIANLVLRYKTNKPIESVTTSFKRILSK